MTVSFSHLSCRLGADRFPGAVWGQGGVVSATHGAKDVVSVMAVTKGLASITVTIGNSRRVTFETNSQNPVSYFEVPIDRHTTGPVLLALNGRTTTGAEIVAGCDESEVSSLVRHKHPETGLTKAKWIDSGVSQCGRHPGLDLKGSGWVGQLGAGRRGVFGCHIALGPRTRLVKADRREQTRFFFIVRKVFGPTHV